MIDNKKDLEIKLLKFCYDEYFNKYYWVEKGSEIWTDYNSVRFVTFSFISTRKLNDLLKKNGLDRYFKFNKLHYCRPRGKRFSLTLKEYDTALIGLFQLQGLDLCQ